MKKLLLIMGLISVTALNAGGSGAATALNDEIISMGKTLGTVLFLFIIVAYIGIPIGAMFFGKGQAKKKAEQNGDEAGGITSLVWAMGAGIVGFFTVFIVVGFLGSMMDKSTSDIDLVKGNKHIIAGTLGAMLSSTESDIAGSGTP